MYKRHTPEAEQRFRMTELRMFQQDRYTVSYDTRPETDVQTFRIWLDKDIKPFKVFETNSEVATYCRDVLRLKIIPVPSK